MLLPLSLAGFLSFAPSGPNGPNPLHFRLTTDASLVVLRNEEESRLGVLLVRGTGARKTSKEFWVPTVFGKPTSALKAGFDHGKTWLVLCSEDLSQNTASFCLLVDLTKQSVKTLFVDHAGQNETAALLGKGVIREENIAKWIFPHVSQDDWNVLWTRKGRFDRKSESIVFGPWVRPKPTR